MHPIRRAVLTVGGAAVVGLAVVGGAALAQPATHSATPQTLDAGAAVDAVLAADRSAAPDAPRRGALRRLVAWRSLIHATAVLDLPALGGVTTVQLDHGTVSATSATSLTIAEADDSSATVGLSEKTRVRKDRAKATAGDLRAGDEVFVMSRVEADGTEAYLVVVPKG